LRSKAARNRNTAKVQDESQLIALKEEQESLKIQMKIEQDEKYTTWMRKTLYMMKEMSKFHPHCSIRFLKYPNRLDLKYERSFTMAIKKNRNDLID